MSLSMMTEAFKVKVGNPARKLVLVKLADNANDLGECWPSYGHIARECEMGRSTVKAHIRALADAGFLTIEERRRGRESSSNMYRLTLSKGQPIQRTPPRRPGKEKPSWTIIPGQPLTPSPGQRLIHPRSAVDRGRSAVDPPPGQPLTPEPVTMNQSGNQSENPTCASAMREAFEVFYAAGLPKKSRARAEQAFKVQARKHDDPLAFARMLAENIKGRLGTGELGFDKMHPSTYLNQQRWLDETAPAGQTNPNAPACPHDEILTAWAEVMPDKPQPHAQLWQGSTDAINLAARWEQVWAMRKARTGQPLYQTREEGIAWWRSFFQFLRRSRFLMEECRGFGLGWVADRDHFARIYSLQYHDVDGGAQ